MNEFGFSRPPGDNDIATYAATVTNPNSTWAVLHMLVLIDFYGADDKFLAGEEVSITVLPGQTTAIVGQSFGSGAAARIEVRPPEDLTAFVPFAKESPGIDVRGLTSSEDAGIRTTRGTLDSHLPVDQGYLQLALVYRDDGGAVIGGNAGAVELLPAGGAAAFEISDSAAPAGVSDVEVYWRLGGGLW